MDDIFYMQEALAEAKKAFCINEVPVGCVIVYKNEIIARSYNTRNTNKNPLAHAEISAINDAAKFINDWRLEECSLYVTIEPCPMCAGAILQARIPKLIFGAKNKKAGAVVSILNMLNDARFNHQAEVTFGVLEQECSELMSRFFREYRRNNTV